MEKVRSKQKQTSEFYEMNIRIGGPDFPKDNNLKDLVNDPLVMKQLQETVISAINDNYQVLVYNFIKNGGQLSDKDMCPLKVFDLEKLWNESETRGLPHFDNPVTPNFSQIKQCTRLTFVCDDTKFVHQIINLTSGSNNKAPLFNSYDIIAVRTEATEQLFEQCCVKSDVDIISLDLSKKLNYYLTKVMLKQALQRGIQFEICYGSQCLESSQVNRKLFLQNAMNMIKLTRGKGIILSSESSNRVYQRSPVDTVNLGIMLGLSQDEALNAITSNSENVFKHAHLRKTYKGVAEIVKTPLPIIKQQQEEEQKMQMEIN